MAAGPYDDCVIGWRQTLRRREHPGFRIVLREPYFQQTPGHQMRSVQVGRQFRMACMMTGLFTVGQESFVRVKYVQREM
jgi:hypothetical protein